VVVVSSLDVAATAVSDVHWFVCFCVYVCELNMCVCVCVCVCACICIRTLCVCVHVLYINMYKRRMNSTSSIVLPITQNFAAGSVFIYTYQIIPE
jgi:hypothetical protein